MGGFQRRRTGGIKGFVNSDSKVGVMPGGGMPGQGKKPGKDKGKFHVSALEFKSGHLAGGTGTVTVV